MQNILRKYGQIIGKMKSCIKVELDHTCYTKMNIIYCEENYVNYCIPHQ